MASAGRDRRADPRQPVAVVGFRLQADRVAGRSPQHKSVAGYILQRKVISCFQRAAAQPGPVCLSDARSRGNKPDVALPTGSEPIPVQDEIAVPTGAVKYIENKDPVAPWGGVRVQAASCKTAAARAVLPINNLAFSAPTPKNCHFMIPGI